MAAATVVCVAGPQDAVPTFRARVDVSRLTVTVLDEQRRAVRDLTAEDFAVLEDGQPLPIVSVARVDLPPRDTTKAAWVADVAPDVATNQTQPDRLIAIVFDDARTGVGDVGWDPSILKTGKQVAREVVAAMSGNDRAAVLFTYKGQPQDFTTDRSRLFTAIDSFVPQESPGGGVPLGCAFRGTSSDCTLETLLRVAETLRDSHAARKVLVYIAQKFAGLDADTAVTFHETGSLPSSDLTDLQRLFQRSTKRTSWSSPLTRQD
jgi:VWFA-related protein